MARRRTRKEIDSWTEEVFRGRVFVRAIVPRGLNEDLPYTVAQRIAGRYEVKRFFASGGFGLLLTARDLHTDTDVLIKTTLRYDLSHHARFRDRDEHMIERARRHHGRERIAFAVELIDPATRNETAFGREVMLV